MEHEPSQKIHTGQICLFQYVRASPESAVGVASIHRSFGEGGERKQTITQDLARELKQTTFYRLAVATVTDPTHAMLRLELAGLWKTLGHPIIDMDQSTRSWFQKGTVLKPGLEPAAIHINNMFKKEFCRQFYKTHKRWPNVNINSMPNPQILACIHANEWGETSSHKWSPEDFEGIDLDTLIPCLVFYLVFYLPSLYISIIKIMHPSHFWCTTKSTCIIHVFYIY